MIDRSMGNIESVLVTLLLGFTFAVSAETSTCERQKIEIAKQLSASSSKQEFISEFVFGNDNKPDLQITWGSPNSRTVLAVTVESYRSGSTIADVYRSTDDGRSFQSITNQISPDKPLKLLNQFALQRNPVNSSQIYLASPGDSNSVTNVHISMDGGASWHLTVLPFLLTEPFIFHSKQSNLALARSGSTLFLTRDGVFSWTRLKENVFKATWGSAPAIEPNAIYIAQEGSTASNPSAGSSASVVRDATAGIPAGSLRLPSASRCLLKSNDLGENWREIAKDIYSYVGRENFLFVSRGEIDGISRRLEVSTDYGASFHRTSLPSIQPDSFATLMDVANGLAFVYIDSGSFKGYGTLYTSDASGRLFSKSLERHLYPPGSQASDFYRVESMPGTFLTTVYRTDGTLGTLISHNRGANWEPLSAPPGVDGCAAGIDCQLQLVSEISIANGQAEPPVSLAAAPGLLVAHGNVGSSLRPSSLPDVYISSDGGYSWARALNGPHKIRLGNNGGFIAALPIGSSAPRLIKFSTDAGRCWHSYNVTIEDYRFTGFVSEPGSRATSVAIWGNSERSHNWRIFVIDFAAVLTRECSQTDYEPWLINGELSSTGSAAGSTNRRACLFGAKVTIMRLKPDSMCANNYSYTPSETIEPCNCNKEDFGCEFGYTRELGRRDCVRDSSVPELDVCTDTNSVDRIISDGYRKLPGNRCVGGFAPNRTQQTALKGENCSQLLHRQRQRAEAAASAELGARAQNAYRLISQLSAADAEAVANQRRHVLSIVLPLCAVLGALLVVILALVVAAKLRERRRRLIAFQYSVISSAGREEDGRDFGNQPRKTAAAPPDREALLTADVDITNGSVDA